MRTDRVELLCFSDVLCCCTVYEVVFAYKRIKERLLNVIKTQIFTKKVVKMSYNLYLVTERLKSFLYFIILQLNEI